MGSTSGSEAGSDDRKPVQPQDPSWKVTLWFLGSFVVGVYLTQLLVVGALYAAERFLP